MNPCLETSTAAARAPHWQARLGALDSATLAKTLDQDGFAVISRLLDAATARGIAGWYDAPPAEVRFRSKVVMARHGFGRGEYQYFDDPLPDLVETLRQTLYEPLARVAHAWQARSGEEARFPATLTALRARCRAAGQCRPTPLLLKYRAGDYNCLHQDLYGDLVFPLQVAVLLSAPGADFEGGEFVLTEQRPRRQSRAHVVPLTQGDAVVFAVNTRPVQGTRGVYAARLRHGVSTVLRGQRHALGVIFHDAR